MFTSLAITVGFLVGYLYGLEQGKAWQFKHMLGIILDMDMTPLNAGERRHIMKDKSGDDYNGTTLS